MPRISPERRAAQRQRILDAMLTCIQRRGLAATSMTDVIAESGLSAGAIYGYFSGKEEILIEAASKILAGRADEVQRLAEQEPVPPPGTLVRALIGTIPDAALTGGAIVQVWGAAAAKPELRDQVREVVAEAQRLVGHYLERWFAQQGHPEPEEAARRASPPLIGLIQGYIVRSALLGPVDLDEFVAGTELLLAGQT